MQIRYQLIAPDYPGFGQSEAPPPSRYRYTFDHLAETMGALLEQLRRWLEQTGSEWPESLIAKSMVAAHPLGAMMRCRLLDTTRAYALTIKVDEAELADMAVRHATYYRRPR